MDAVHELAQGGAPAGTAVVAQVQTAGRGSRGRTWTSPRGGLWLSVLARPASAGLEVLSLRAGLAVAERLDDLGAEACVRLKWPNDLMLGERKVGGILCEARWQGAALAWVVIGLGLNVANPPPSELETTATHLGAACSRRSTADDLVEPVVAALRAVDAAAGPAHRARSRRGSPPGTGCAGAPSTRPWPAPPLGLAADGALLVRRADGVVERVLAGAVVTRRSWRRPAPASRSPHLMTRDPRSTGLHAPDARHRQHRDHRRACSAAPSSTRTGGSRPIRAARRTSGAARSAASCSPPATRRTRCARCASPRWRRR